jgi:hypothetical protein
MKEKFLTYGVRVLFEDKKMIVTNDQKSLFTCVLVLLMIGLLIGIVGFVWLFSYFPLHYQPVQPPEY